MRYIAKTALLCMLIALLARGVSAYDLKSLVFDGVYKNQKPIHLSEYVGKQPIILVFFYPQCPPCEREVKIINKLYEKYHSKALIIGVSLSRDKYDIQDFIDDNNVKYPIYMIKSKNQLKAVGGILATPTTLLVDAKGRVRKKIIGERKFKHYCKDIQRCFNKHS